MFTTGIYETLQRRLESFTGSEMEIREWPSERLIYK